MKIKQFILEFFVFFGITFIVSIAVSYIYNILFHGAGKWEWVLAFRTALLFALIFPILDWNRSRRQPK